MAKPPPGVYPHVRKDGTRVYRVKVYDRATKKGRWIGTFDGPGAAKEAKRQAEGLPRIRRRLTVAAYVERWPRLHPRPRESTHTTYGYAIRPFVADFGGLRLDQIDRVTALEWGADQPLSVTDTVRIMYGDAVNDGLASYNPFANLRRRRSKGRADISVISSRELDYLADTASDLWQGHVGATVRAMILVAAYSGVRPSELFAFEHTWIDRANAEIVVHHQLDRQGKAQPTKTRQPRRIVLLASAAEALASVPRTYESTLIFRTARGRPFNEAKWSYYWHPVRAAFGDPEMDFYELRHYCATLLLAQGLQPADVATQLGHSDGGELVMRLYGHPSKKEARARIKRADRRGLVPIAGGMLESRSLRRTEAKRNLAVAPHAE